MPEGYFDASKIFGLNRQGSAKETPTVKSFIKRKASYSTTLRRGVVIVDNGFKSERKQQNNNIHTVTSGYDGYDASPLDRGAVKCSIVVTKYGI